MRSNLTRQKHPPKVFYKKAVLNNRNNHGKTPVLESLFSKVANGCF